MPARRWPSSTLSSCRTLPDRDRELMLTCDPACRRLLREERDSDEHQTGRCRWAASAVAASGRAREDWRSPMALANRLVSAGTYSHPRKVLPEMNIGMEIPRPTSPGPGFGAERSCHYPSLSPQRPAQVMCLWFQACPRKVDGRSSPGQQSSAPADSAGCMTIQLILTTAGSLETRHNRIDDSAARVLDAVETGGPNCSLHPATASQARGRRAGGHVSG